MTIATYPGWLPKPLKAGKTRQTAPGFRITEAYRGRAYTQPIGTDVPVFWDLTFRFTQAQAQAFWLWFETVINRGAEPFTMDLRTEFGAVNHELQFMPDGLLPTTEDGPHFTYKATVLARKLVIPDEYLLEGGAIAKGVIVMNETTVI